MIVIENADFSDFALVMNTVFWQQVEPQPLDNGNAARWNLGSTGPHAKNGVLTYSFNLTENGEFLASEALKVYSSVLGITFQEHQGSGRADIEFSTLNFGNRGGVTLIDDGSGIVEKGSVLISASVQSAPTLTGGAFATVMHELGHALGLGHTGLFNGNNGDPIFGNDSKVMSIMSYEGAGTPFTPMSADWVALNNAYGQYGYGTGSAFLGDTTWGFNTNITDESGLAFSRLTEARSTSIFTIIDDGGNDTVDFSGYSGDQRIDLGVTQLTDTRPVGSRIESDFESNMYFAVGTVIENAVGGSGDDELIGNEFVNSIFGGAGDDTISGLETESFASGALDALFGGDGDDQFLVTSGRARFDGGDGFDTVDYSGFGSAVNLIDHSFMSLGEGIGDHLIGIERVIGSQFDDVFDGNDDQNSYFGGLGADLIYGGGGDDTISGDEGTDTIFGGAGDNDFVEYVGSDAAIEIVLDGLGVGGHAEGDQVFGVEGVIGSRHNDILHGNSSDNFLFGGNEVPGTNSGNDVLRGNGGNDQLVGNGGTDSLFGGDGSDEIFGGSGQDWAWGGDHSDSIFGGGARDQLKGEDGNDFLDGGHAADVLDGGTGADQLFGGNGNDHLLGGSGVDSMAGGNGDDRYFVDQQGDQTIELENAGYDWVYTSIDWVLSEHIEGASLSGADNISIVGNNIANWVSGNAGSNMLFGFAGNDRLRGGDGSDTLNGGADNDILEGMGGIDTFQFFIGSGVDVITDFDMIDERVSFVVNGLTYEDLSISDTSHGALIIYNDGNASAMDMVTLNGVSASELDESHFVFASQGG